jgi:hypothetical protein
MTSLIMPASAGRIELPPYWLWLPGVTVRTKTSEVRRYGERIVLPKKRYEYTLELTMAAIESPDGGLKTDNSYTCNPPPEEQRECDPDVMARNLKRHLKKVFGDAIQRRDRGYGFDPALGTPGISPRVLEQTWIDERILRKLRDILKRHGLVTLNV